MSFRPIARFITRYPAIIITGILAITIGLGSGMLRLQIDTDLTDDIPSTIPEKVFYDQVGQIFPSDDFLLIALTNSNGVFTPEVLSQVKTWSDTIEAIPGVKSVLSLSSASLIKGTEAGIQIEPAMQEVPTTPESIEAFKTVIQTNDLTKTLIGKDGKSTALIITLKENLDTTPVPRYLIQIDEKKGDEVAAKVAQTEGVAAVLRGSSDAERFTLASVYAIDAAKLSKKGLSTIVVVPSADADHKVLLANLSALIKEIDQKTGKVSFTDKGIPFYDRITATLPLLDNKTDGKTYISGSRAVSGIVTRLLVQDLSLLFPIVILIIILVLYLSFRSLRGVLLPLGNVIISVIWAMGLMGWLNQAISNATMVLPIILIAVGTAYTIHVINRYYEELGKTGDKKTAIEETITHVALPVFLAGATTFIGFMSLAVSRIDALRMFGILSALGILFALVLSLTLTPAIMVVLRAPKRAFHRSTEPKGRLAETLGALGSKVVHHPKTTVGIGLLLIAFLAIFIPKVKFETNTINSFKKGSEVRTASEYLNENFTGITVMTIIASTTEDGAILEPATLKAIDGLQTRLEQLRLYKEKVIGPEDPNWAKGTEIVGGSQSIVTFIKGINKAFNNDNEAFNRVPDEENPVPVSTEVYTYKGNSLIEKDSETGEVLSTYTEGQDFSVADGYAILEMGDYTRKVDLATGKATDIIPGRTYVGQLVFQYENSGKPETIEAFLDSPRKTIKINVFIKTASSTLIGQIQKEARTYIAQNFPKTVSADITGLSNLTLAVLRLLVESQISSVLSSLIIVFLFITLLSRSFVEGFFSIIPLSASLLFNFGFMGLFNIPIDISTATIASIGIGVGIDYTLHFLERLKSYLCHMEYDEAVKATMETTGKGIFFNALAVAAGFAALMFSQLRGNFFMGLLLSLIMITSSTFAVTLLPALLKLINPKFLHKQALKSVCEDDL
ncbi:MAG: MMPL family transporter [Spirochaetota bacterium]